VLTRFIGGNLFIVGGIMEILIARFLFTGIDEMMYQVLQEWHDKK